MIVVMFGGRASGGARAFRLLREALALAGDGETKLPDTLVVPARNTNTVSKWTDQLLHKLLDATRGARVAIRTEGAPDHLTAGALFDALETGELKVHVVYRDPREIVLRLLHERRGRPAATADVDAAIAILRADLRKLRHWGTFPSLKLGGDAFALDPGRVAEQIVTDLGLTVDPNDVVVRAFGDSLQPAMSQPGWRALLPTEDAVRVAAAVPNYLRMVEQRDASWFHRVG